VEAALDEARGLAIARTDDGFTALHLIGFFSGDERCARLLLDAGADPDALAANGTGLRPINSAAAAGSNEVVALLLERGADVDATQRGGFTPLHSAGGSGNGELVEMLVAAGADETRRTEDGRTAAAFADERGYPNLARRLERLAAERD
jgi:ankyrin repeat protein